MLAQEQHKRVALVDLDLFFGSCGLTLDLEMGPGFREALENPSRIDGLFIERAMIRATENLFVLSAEEALDYAIAFDPSAIELLLEHLRRDFQAVVVDLPRFGARTQTAIMTPPCSIVLVSEPSLAGMRDTQRLVKLFTSLAPKAELSVVLTASAPTGAPSSTSPTSRPAPRRRPASSSRSSRRSWRPPPAPASRWRRSRTGRRAPRRSGR
jgi:pilus assembly protein CpaE